MEPRDIVAERAEIDAEIAGGTLLTAFAETVDRLGQREALKWKQGGIWRCLTWRQYGQAVDEVALGLLDCGLRPGEFALVMSRNRPEAFIADLAVLHARGVPVFVYNTLAPEQIAYIANHCQAAVAVLEDRGFLARFDVVRSRLLYLRQMVVVDGPAPGDDRVRMWADVRSAGRQSAERSPGRAEDLRRLVTPEDLATVIYTSGTTGPPKGVMLTHRNARWFLASLAPVFEARPEDRQISYLPLAHLAEHMWSLAAQAVRGFTIHTCPDPALLFETAREVRPTLFGGVPRVWEKLHAAITTAITAEPDASRRREVESAIETARQVVRLRQRGEQVSRDLAAAGERAGPVLRAILSKVGLDQCRYALTAAAPLGPDVIEFFQALGLNMGECWGLSELPGSGTLSPRDAHRSGTVGKALPGLELQVAEDGEILVRGPGVMKGYYRAPEQTEEAVDAEGWLHTGDLGELDAEGYLRIVGRKKELIITAGGKNISPANIEYLLQRHPLIGQACVIGDRRPYVTALLALDPEVAPAWARGHSIEGHTLAELGAHPEILAEVQRGVDGANSLLSRVEQVKRWRLLPVEWTAEGGELTPTMKRRRRVIVDRYAREIDDLYTTVGGDIVAPQA